MFRPVIAPQRSRIRVSYSPFLFSKTAQWLRLLCQQGKSMTFFGVAESKDERGGDEGGLQKGKIISNSAMPLFQCQTMLHLFYILRILRLLCCIVIVTSEAKPEFE